MRTKLVIFFGLLVFNQSSLSAFCSEKFKFFRIGISRGVEQTTKAKDPLYENMKLLELIPPKEADRPIYSPEHIRAEMRQSLEPLEGAFPAAKELSTILNRSYSSATKLRGDLGAWLKQNNIPFQFLAGSSQFKDPVILREFLKDTFRGHVNPESVFVVASENSYINNHFWFWAYSKAFHPVADAHDITSHFPMMLLEGVSDNYSLQGRLGTYLSTIKNEDRFASTTAQANGRTPKEVQVAAKILIAKIGGPLRNLVFENLPVIQKVEGEWKMAVLGNRVYSFENLIDQPGGPRLVAERWMGVVYKKNPILSTDGILPLDLPKRVEYLESSSKAKALLRELEISLNDLGLHNSAEIESATAALDLHIRAAIKELGLKPFDLSVSDRNYLNYAKIQNILGKKISNDAKLASFFDYRKRIRFWTSSLNLYRDYIHWLLPKGHE